MEFNKTLNSKRNIIWGWFNRIVKIITPFLFRTVLIKKLGIEYLGINSLFNSILGILSLAELGFDAAVVSIMYKYVAEDKKDEISILLNFLKKTYFCVGSIIIIVGGVLIPFLPHLIKDINSVPNDINIYFVYIIFLLNSAVSYFFGGYKNSIFNSYQRVDIISNIYTFILLTSFLTQVFIIIVFKNYSLYIITMPVFTIINNLIIVIMANKYYPELKPKGKLGENDRQELIKKIKGAFFTKIGSVLSYSFDNIIISSFLGITLLAKYTNYFYLISAVQGFLTVINVSIQPIIGNLIYTKSVEENYSYLTRLTFIYNWIVSFCCCCFIMLVQPFVVIWLGKDYQLPTSIVYSLTFSFYFSTFDSILGIYKAAKGIWWEDRYRCFIAGIVNLVLNYSIAVVLQNKSPYYVLLGVSISTFVSSACIGTPWATFVTFKIYFKTGLKNYTIRIFQFFLVSIMVCSIVIPIWSLFSPLLSNMNKIFTFIIQLVYVTLFFNLFMYLCYFKTNVFKNSKQFLAERIAR